MDSTETGPMDKPALARWICDWVSTELGIPRDQVDPGQSFMNYNMNSMSATMLVGDLEDRLSRRLSPTLAWDYPTVDDLVEHLCATSE